MFTNTDVIKIIGVVKEGFHAHDEKNTVKGEGTVVNFLRARGKLYDFNLKLG